MFEHICILCPYCGEPLNAALEHVRERRDYASDCPVCFCPILFRVSLVMDGRFKRVLAVRDLERVSA